MTKHIFSAVSSVQAQANIGLTVAMAHALGIQPGEVLSRAISIRRRLQSIETADGSTWYYLDGRCIYGKGPIRCRAEAWGEMLHVTQAELDPATAPTLPQEAGQ